MSEGISLSAAMHVWRRSLVLYRRTWLINLLPNFFEPVVYLVGMGIGLGAYIQEMEGMAYLAFLTPGLIVSNAMNGASFETTYNLFVKIHFNRTYDAIVATPINIADAMLGEVIWAITRGLIYGGVFAIITTAFGLIDPLGLLAMLPVVFLAAWLFAAVGLAFTSFIKVIDLYSFYYTLFLTPMFFLSGIFFPLEKFPAWVTTTAWFTPLYHVVLLAKAAAHRTWEVSLLGNIAWVLLVSALLTWLGVWRVQRSLVK